MPLTAGPPPTGPPAPMGRCVRQGALAGLAGGAAMAAVLALAGQGAIGRAIALEAGGGGDEVFGRGAQQAGGMLGALIFGVVVGTLFGVAFAVVRRRMATGDGWRAAVALAATGFLTVFVVPFLRYPANPPGVGDPDTISRRTALYVLALAWSLVATWAAWRAGRALAGRRLGDHVRLPAVAATWVGLVTVGLLALPSTSDPLDVPAGLLWEFRLATVGGALALWAVTGTVFGWLEVRRTAATVAERARQPV